MDSTPRTNMATTTEKEARIQPEWYRPSSSNTATLKLYNSLTKSKTEFIPKNGRQVTWYNCGPTVYDASHMGHARTYLAMDILRRILEDYFHYDVLFVQNITDIDDKIILKARQEHLFSQREADTKTLDAALVNEVQQAWTQYAQSKLSETAPNAYQDWESFKSRLTADDIAKALLIDEKFKMHVAALDKAYAALKQSTDLLQRGESSKEEALDLIGKTKDVYCVYLDKLHGHTVTDPKIFRDIPAFYEAAFFADMEALGIKAPDVQTRVSEYIPEITEYVQKIIANGYAYEADQSVYFDTAKYDNSQNHQYAKLEPSSKGNMALVEDGEGSLGSKLQGKRSPNDFALWKKSKPGEPSWNSPWGPGRPGWHIECSVMASAVLGDNMDIHSGGIDLAFPHHDNELAQSEAYYDCKQWVNYFLHAGHLHVEGQKMSKSLKNFITIQEALQKYSARQLRLYFLLKQWNAKMDFKESSMQEVYNLESTLNNFFANVKALLRDVRNEPLRGADERPNGLLTHRFRAEEKGLMQTLALKQQAVHEALCDSIDTARAMNEISELVSAANIYISKGGRKLNAHVLNKVATWITSMLKVFGLTSNGEAIGFPSTASAGQVSTEEIAMPYLQALSSFRDNIRQLAIEKKPHVDFLRLSDKLRDDDMVALGVSLDDQEDGKALVKLVPREELLKAREAKLAREAEREAKKKANADANERKRLERLEKGKVAPTEMFRTDEYTQWDENGIPTHDMAGEEVAKSRRKKLQKEWDMQNRLHQEYQAHLKQI
ncbi:hypothetical protein BZG36_04436 [Bifiguratus adelaidae]|uniref:cysteine--tRNA ligase n=1 Tax=Bifiguratus adelaidae TaxID=1938954 RepID=A0A261XVK7_9FUNG|nr:hypothetical protein BZG36_04436 [Bifiguratus adelaidae]